MLEGPPPPRRSKVRVNGQHPIPRVHSRPGNHRGRCSLDEALRRQSALGDGNGLTPTNRPQLEITLHQETAIELKGTSFSSYITPATLMASRRQYLMVITDGLKAVPFNRLGGSWTSVQRKSGSSLRMGFSPGF